MARRRTRRKPQGLSYYKLHELLHGPVEPEFCHPSIYDGYGEGDPDLEAMKIDWEFFGERLTKWWKANCPHSEFEQYGLPLVQCKPWIVIGGCSDKLPWAAKKFRKKL
jgi:hypothetical protein